MSAFDPAGGLNPRVAELGETHILLVAQHGRGRDDVVPLWFGEGDVQTPAFVCRAAADALIAGETFYTFQQGIPVVRDALRDYMNRRFGLATKASQHTLVSSGMTSIFIAMMTLVEPGDEVVVVGPVWPNVYSAVRVNGGIAVHVPLALGAGGWTLDLQRLLDAVTPRTKAIFVNSPGNPTGWVMDADDQRALVEFARARGIWLVADEVYHNLVYDREVAPSFLQVAAPEDRLLVVNSCSKSWLMTGWRLGWITHHPSLGPTLAKMIQIVTSGAPQFLQRGAVAALREGDGVIAELRARCARGRDLVFGRLRDWHGVTAVPPKGAFYAFLRVHGLENSLEFCKRMIDEAGVGLAPGSAFGPAGEGHVRICFAGTPELLTRGLDRLAPFLGGQPAA